MSKRIAVLVSGGGTNLQALINAQARGELVNGEIAAVISSNPGAYALERAAKAGIPGYVVARKEFSSSQAMTAALVEKLRALDIDLVVLAGFMVILTSEMVRAFPNAILNVHPALIPSFAGPGCYGLHVHENGLPYLIRGEPVPVLDKPGDALAPLSRPVELELFQPLKVILQLDFQGGQAVETALSSLESIFGGALGRDASGFNGLHDDVPDVLL